MTIEEFSKARYGMFVHFGLYSLLGRGEWVMNREEIPRETYRALADKFKPEAFQADELARLAVDSGMKYLVFTTMHHDGFRLYHSDLTDFCSTKTAAKRDFTEEMVAACQKHGLKIGLYHSLNNWMDLPDAVDALEDKSAYEDFIEKTHRRIEELVRRFNPVDILWYDGWWPFHAAGWQSERMNAMVRAIQPHILFNGRNALPGDFATPEGHLSSPTPWRPWEGCLTLNDSWGYSEGDQNWKTPAQVISLLTTCASRQGNLLLNVGPRGDGSIPEATLSILRDVGNWLKLHQEAIFGTDFFTFDLREEGNFRSEWNHAGSLTARGNNLFWIIKRWPKEGLTLGGLQVRVKRAAFLHNDASIDFQQDGTRLQLRGLPQAGPTPLLPVIRLECDAPPKLYQCGGMRRPKVPHPHYDPVESDIMH